ncbi:hypothetical protein H7827_14890 [Streptomyces sp. JH002]|jgi:hypothetical protein|uniref:hypothetical protein n=1 Tax=Streptomyces TaxID=1883 RepID=UPI00367F0519
MAHMTLSSVFNSDGHSHPVPNILAAVTAVLGPAALLLSLWPGMHLAASWAGLAGIATGGWGQLVSATTAERFVLVIGLGAAATGFYLGMAHGGLFGGVLG